MISCACGKNSVCNLCGFGFGSYPCECTPPLAITSWACPFCAEKDAENAKLKARVAELEAQIAETKQSFSALNDSEEWDDWNDLAGAMV